MTHFGVKELDLKGKMRREVLAKAREALVYAGLKCAGKTGQELAEELKKSRGAISQAYYRACGWIKGNEPWLSVN